MSGWDTATLQRQLGQLGAERHAEQAVSSQSQLCPNAAYAAFFKFQTHRAKSARTVVRV